MLENMSREQIDQLRVELKDAQLRGIQAGTPLNHQFKMAQKTLAGDTEGEKSVQILKAAPSSQNVVITQAVAATHLLKICSQELAATAEKLSNAELATRYLGDQASNWEKTEIESLLVDRHEEQVGEEAHDELLETTSDPLKEIALKFTQP